MYDVGATIDGRVHVVVDLVDTAEICARWGTTPYTVRRYLATGAIPAPAVRLGERPIWDGAVIDAWAEARGWTRKDN